MSAAPTAAPLTVGPTQTPLPTPLPTTAPVAAPTAAIAPTPTVAPTSTPSPRPLTVTITASTYGRVAALTVPGALCSADAYLPGGVRISDARLGTSQTADSSGIVSWTYSTTTTATSGTGTQYVFCTDGRPVVTAQATFTVGIVAAPTGAATPSPVPSTAGPPVAGNVIETCIEGDFKGWSGDTAFDLCNGQVWVQTSYAYTYHYAYRPRVTLVRTSTGWTMSVEGVSSSIAVQQAPSFVRSCINGTFEGWSGDTLFPLCNGQIWQQVGLGITIAIAIRPQVLIYEAPTGGYRMQVEGTDGTIRVARIK